MFVLGLPYGVNRFGEGKLKELVLDCNAEVCWLHIQINLARVNVFVARKVQHEILKGWR